MTKLIICLQTIFKEIPTNQGSKSFPYTLEAPKSSKFSSIDRNNATNEKIHGKKSAPARVVRAHARAQHGSCLTRTA